MKNIFILIIIIIKPSITEVLFSLVVLESETLKLFFITNTFFFLGVLTYKKQNCTIFKNFLLKC